MINLLTLRCGRDGDISESYIYASGMTDDGST